ncbi:MAG: hypothetical protein ACXAEX_01045 [Promethearchaeota archaeon]
MPTSESEQLIHAEELMYKGKFEESLGIIESFEAIKGSKIHLSVLSLKGRIYFYRGEYAKVVEVGEIAYLESQKSSNNQLALLEALIFKAYIIYFGKYKDAFEYILEAEEIIKTLSKKSIVKLAKPYSDFLLIKSIIYNSRGDLNKALDLALQCLEKQEEIGERLDLSRIFMHLGDMYLYKGESDIALDYAMKGLKMQKELNNMVGIANCYHLIGLSYYTKGDFEQALEFGKKSLAIEEISVYIKIDILHLLGIIYKERGQPERTIRYYKRSLAISEKHKYMDKVQYNLMGIGSAYRVMGDLEKATEFLERSLNLARIIGTPYGMMSSLFYLTLINLDKNNLKVAHQYLDELGGHINQEESRVFKDAYFIAKALVIKKSGRIRDHSEAELLLKQVSERKIATPQIYLIALVNLCDLFIEELFLTNNIDVLDELNPLIDKIHEIAENQNAYLWLTETKLLQAKLALIQMKIDEAKQLLTEAQRVAEIKGLNLLAIKISNEHDNLLEKLNVWDNLKEINAPMSERIKLASFNGVIDRLQGRKAIEPINVNPESPVLLLIIGEGGVPLFSTQFAEQYFLEEDLLSGFLAAFNAFSDELFSKGLDRAKFGDYMILFKSVNSYSVCYLFKGSTFLAKQKILRFSELIRTTNSIWQTLNKFHQTSQVVELKDVPELKSLISEIFIK